jgi:hypothetical protein
MGRDRGGSQGRNGCGLPLEPTAGCELAGRTELTNRCRRQKGPQRQPNTVGRIVTRSRFVLYPDRRSTKRWGKSGTRVQAFAATRMRTRSEWCGRLPPARSRRVGPLSFASVASRLKSTDEMDMVTEQATPSLEGRSCSSDGKKKVSSRTLRRVFETRSLNPQPPMSTLTGLLEFVQRESTMASEREDYLGRVVTNPKILAGKPVVKERESQLSSCWHILPRSQT